MYKFILVLLLITQFDVRASNELDNLIRSGNCSKVQTYADKILTEKLNDISALYAKGYCYHKEKSYYQAEKEFLKVHSQNTKYRRVNYNLADIYLLLNRHESAIKYAAQDIKLNPEDSDSFSLLAISHGYLGNKEESIKYFNESLKLNPRNMKSLYELALLHLKNRENDEACKVFNRAEKIEPQIAKLAARKDACGI